MGSQIDPNMTFAGLRAVEVRDLLKKVYNISFAKAWLTEKGFTPARSERLIKELKASGYIEEDRPFRSTNDTTRWYRLTDQGRAFARSSAAKRIRRSHAEKSLEALLKRAIELNSDDSFLAQITELVVFGSLLSDSESLGDIDLAYATAERVSHADAVTYYSACEESFYANGRTSKTILDIPAWPQEQVRLRLKNHRRIFSLHAMQEFVGLQADRPSPYRVLIGDPDQIRERITKQQTSQTSK